MEVVTVERDFPGVLIVDDHAAVRSFLRIALEATARVTEAEDGARAIEILEEQASPRGFDLVLADQVLPKRSGLEILCTAKRRWPWLRVVIITAFGSEDLAVQALRAGASDYLRKPIDLETLRKTVATLTAVRADTATSRPTPHGDQPAPQQVVHPSIRRTLAFVREHYAGAITLTDGARAAGLSRFHFCRLFHREMGMPFHEYLREIRVGHAKTLLADRYLRVSEVAYAVGFNDLSHFDRTFRRIVGRSPRQYRSSLRCA